jgi:small subunit ribosomal protein S5
MVPSPRGSGVRGNNVVRSVCEAAGMTDMSIKVIGRHNRLNTVRAAVGALERMESDQDFAQRRGLTMAEAKRRMCVS